MGHKSQSVTLRTSPPGSTWPRLPPPRLPSRLPRPQCLLRPAPTLFDLNVLLRKVRFSDERITLISDSLLKLQICYFYANAIHVHCGKYRKYTLKKKKGSFRPHLQSVCCQHLRAHPPPLPLPHTWPPCSGKLSLPLQRWLWRLRPLCQPLRSPALPWRHPRGGQGTA